MNEFSKNNNNSFLICPNECFNVPEIEYSYEPMNPSIKYKCNSIRHGPMEKRIQLEDFLKKRLIYPLIALLV